MPLASTIRKVAFLGDYLPRKCGIATFTTDLRCAVATEFPALQCLVVPVNDLAGGYDYPPEVRFEIAEQDLPSYLRAADFLNITDVDVVCVQHEFGIFGGPAGSHVLALLRELRMPIVTTLHTILREPNEEQRRVMRDLIRLSTRIVVMSERGVEFLRDVYQAPAAKIDLIPHGIPNMPFADPNYFKDEFGVAGKQVLLTFGLLSPNKGIEFALRSLPEIIRGYPNIVYIVLGQTHPNLLRDEGEAYRLSLERLAKDLGVQKHVVFFNRFVELEELMRFIGAADIYLTPYLTEAQITSGTLAYAFGAGNAVVSTPYWHAVELLSPRVESPESRVQSQHSTLDPLSPEVRSQKLEVRSQTSGQLLSPSPPNPPSPTDPLGEGGTFGGRGSQNESPESRVQSQHSTLDPLSPEVRSQKLEVRSQTSGRVESPESRVESQHSTLDPRLSTVVSNELVSSPKGDGRSEMADGRALADGRSQMADGGKTPTPISHLPSPSTPTPNSQLPSPSTPTPISQLPSPIAERGKLVPFRDAKAISLAVMDLLRDEPLRHSMRKNAYKLGRDMVWSRVAQLYAKSFEQARQDHSFVGRKLSPIKTLDEQPGQLPELKLDHLFRMSDSTGVFQHASFTVPNFAEGYCTDDNARALVLALMLQKLGVGSWQMGDGRWLMAAGSRPNSHLPSPLSHLAATYAAFLNHAFDRQRGRFRNFMSFDRRWLEEIGSEDCQGHALWALGLCVSQAGQGSFQMLAAQLFEQALPVAAEFSSPRAWAFTLIGIDEYLRRFSGDRRANQIREALTTRLLQSYADTAADDWHWFEEVVSYANAKLPHALILSGRCMNAAPMLETGLKALRWLIKVQSSPTGAFRPIGSNGFYQRGQSPAQFDQQPIEAQATVSACIEAYHATNDMFWVAEARRAFEWFLGRNDLGLALYDPGTGGCRDGLHVDRLSQNQGAESTLAFLLALAEKRALQNTLTSFKEPLSGQH